MSAKKGAVRPRSGRTHSRIFRLLDWVTAALLCAAVIALLLFVVFTPVRIQSSSVTGFNAGDIVFADRLSRHFAFYERGDAVVYKVELPGGRAELHIGRVIAYQGEKVRITGGLVYIDGTLMDESEYAEHFSGEVNAELMVPTDALLLLPDERMGVTGDAIAGFIVPLSRVTGEVRFIAHPLSRIRFFN